MVLAFKQLLPASRRVNVLAFKQLLPASKRVNLWQRGGIIERIDYETLNQTNSNRME
jgi:hypothetical protein